MDRLTSSRPVYWRKVLSKIERMYYEEKFFSFWWDLALFTYS